jgi:hypothetical protein
MPVGGCTAPVAFGSLTSAPDHPRPRSSRSASGHVRPTTSGMTMDCCGGRGVEVDGVDGSALVVEVTPGEVVVELGASDAQAAAAITMLPATKAALIRTFSMLAGEKAW